jgi:hypothetical protein
VSLLLPLIFYFFLVVTPYMFLSLIAWNLFNYSQCFPLDLISFEREGLNLELLCDQRIQFI